MKLIERKLSKTGTGRRLKSGSYPRDSFKYLSYNTDPKPDVLILGNWKNQTTKNQLIAGINLNYLSSGQLDRLRKAANRIFRRDTLRSRYRYLKSILPDIAMYYRTYDTKYIKSIEHNELNTYVKPKSSPKDEKIKTSLDTDKASHVTDPAKTIDKNTDELDREAWRLKRRLYEPEKQRRRTSPERIGIAGSDVAKKAKATRYVRDRKKLKELERQVALQKELRKMEEPEELPEPEDVEESDDLGYGPEYHLDDLGYESKSYINNHKPGHRLLSESRGRNLLAVFDTISKQFVVDSVISHAEILFDAGWDYDHTVLFEVVGKELVIKSDCADAIIAEAVEHFKNNIVKNVLCESHLLDEKKHFSITTKPGIDYDKDEVERILTVLHSKPWGDETKFNASRWAYRLIKIDDYWNEKTYRFEIYPKVGEPSKAEPIYSIDIDKEQYKYKEPSAKTEIMGREGFVYRGMSWDEWIKTVKSKQLYSSGTHNIGQDDLTFYGDVETAEYYANGFAPYSFKPTITKPGIVIEIPRSAVKDYTEDNRIPKGEFAHAGRLPATIISRKWKLLPVLIKPGYLDIIVDNRGKISEGSRFSPSVSHAAIEF
jgi:hypothetical protein